MRPTLTILVKVFRKVRCTCDLRAFTTRCMNVDEKKGLSKDRSEWHSVVLYPMAKSREFPIISMS